MKHSKQISILGCGWLGFPLAEQLLKDGYSVRGSVRKKSDLEKLNDSGIEGFLLELGSKNIKRGYCSFPRFHRNSNP